MYLGVGSILVALFLIIVPGALYWLGRTRGTLYARAQWATIFVFPVWLAWFVWSVVTVLAGKTPGFRLFNFIQAFSLDHLGDLSRY